MTSNPDHDDPRAVPDVRAAPGSGTATAVRLPDFVGRVEELAALRDAMAQPSALILVEGEAGIGKSRLLRELLAGQRSRRSLTSACPPFRQPQTLGPVVDAVRHVTDDVTGLGLSPLAGALRSLLPEWAAALPPALEPAEDATAARHRLFRALAELLDRLDVGLLVVEDAHWADEATLEFLLFLVAARTRPGSLVVTYRPEDVPASSLLRQLSSRRPADGVVLRVRVSALDVSETAQMVSSMLAGQPVPADFAIFLHERTDGVPLAIEESLRLMADRADVATRGGGLVRRRLSRIDVPPTIRDAVLERAGRLGDLARVVLRAVAVLAEPAPAGMVAAVAGLDAAQAQAGLAEATACGLVAEDEGGLLAFRHVLASEAIYEAIPATTRQQLHQRAGQALEAAQAAPARIVRHFRESGDMVRCASYAERAADLAVAAGDELGSERLLYDLLGGGLPAPALVRLTGKISFLLSVDDASYEQLADALRSALAVKGLGSADRAALHLQLGRVLLAYDHDEAGQRELAMAVRGLPPGSLESLRAMIRLGMPLGTCPASVHRRWLRRAAAAGASMTGPGRLWAAVDYVTALLLLGEQSGWAAAARLPDDAPTTQEMRQITRAAVNIGELAVTWGHYEQARRQLSRALRLADQYGHKRATTFAVARNALLDWLTGAWDGLAGRAARLAAADDIPPMVRTEAFLVCGLLQEAAGDREQARTCFASCISRNRQFSAMQMSVEPAAAMARLCVADGDIATALEVTDEPVRLVTAKGTWVWAADLAPARVDALVAAGRTDEAAELTAAMGRGLRGRDAPAPRAGLALCRAIVLRARGEHLKAAAAFARAADAWQELPRPYDALLARERGAACLFDAGQRDAAALLLTGTARDFARLGATAAADRAIRTLRQRGVAARRPIPGRPSYGNELSPRELEVVRLLATGHSIRTIAESLTVTTKTVSFHLASARRKLGAPSSAALTVAAMDAGLISLPTRYQTFPGHLPNCQASRRIGSCAHDATRALRRRPRDRRG